LRILVIADIHNDVENIPQFLDRAEELKFDVIVCPGDFLDAPPTGVTREEIGLIILEELKSLGRPVLAVPGNQDDILINVFKEEGMSIHGVGKTIDGVGFYGFGGSKTPFGTAYEPSDSEIGAGLEKAYEEVKDVVMKVQVTHNPPINTKLDIIPSGAHVGSESVRKFIEDKKPDVAVCAHIHEGRGVDVIGNTKVINPGRFPEGYCGIVEISDKGVDAKVVNLI
jgi:Icc-related predicted phosphoesterase